MDHRNRSVLIGSAIISYGVLSASCLSGNSGGPGDASAGGAPSCAGLSEADCSAADCHPEFGLMLVEGEVREVYAGCLARNLLCGTLMICAVEVDDESGACVWFSSTCYPDNFQDVGCSSDGCSELWQAISEGQ